jgi:transposase-like protein
LLTDLKNRGVIACVDGLKGFPQAIETVFPEAQVQLCIVHLTRASLNFVNWKERKAAAADLNVSYRASTAEQAEQELRAFAEKGAPLSRDRSAVGPPLGARDSIFCVSRRDLADHLHHQCRGII